jgi:transposase-like protein
MAKKTRKRFIAQEKVAVLRLHLLEHAPVSDLCDQHGIHATMFYRWQKEFFENGSAALEPRSRRAAVTTRYRDDADQRHAYAASWFHPPGSGDSRSGITSDRASPGAPELACPPGRRAARAMASVMGDITQVRSVSRLRNFNVSLALPNRSSVLGLLCQGPTVWSGSSAAAAWCRRVSIDRPSTCWMS